MKFADQLRKISVTNLDKDKMNLLSKLVDKKKAVQNRKPSGKPKLNKEQKKGK